MNVILTHPGTALQPHKSSKWANITFVFCHRHRNEAPLCCLQIKPLSWNATQLLRFSQNCIPSKFEQEEMSGNKHTRNKFRWRDSTQKEHIWLWHIDKGWLKNWYVLQSIFNYVHTEKVFFLNGLRSRMYRIKPLWSKWCKDIC